MKKSNDRMNWGKGVASDAGDGLNVRPRRRAICWLRSLGTAQRRLSRDRLCGAFPFLFSTCDMHRGHQFEIYPTRSRTVQGHGSIGNQNCGLR